MIYESFILGYKVNNCLNLWAYVELCNVHLITRGALNDLFLKLI